MNKRKSNNWWLLLVIFATLLFISVGYSFFSERLSIVATGVIGEPEATTIKTSILNNETITTSGDGLYLTNFDNKYYYRGTNVNNYLSLNNELWRIISIDNYGNVKIIKNTFLTTTELQTLENNGGFWASYLDSPQVSTMLGSGKLLFDLKGRRPVDSSLANSYCSSTKNGCNAYSTSSYDNLVVDDDSLIKKYLNNVYYQSLSNEVKNLLTNFDINVGYTYTTTAKLNIDSVIESEKAYNETGSIALANVSDYVISSTNANCYAAYTSTDCASTNWMNVNGYQWYLLNAKYNINTAQVWTVYNTGKLSSQDATNSYYIRPVLTVNKSVLATGTGTKDDPYVIEAVNEE